MDAHAVGIITQIQGIIAGTEINKHLLLGIYEVYNIIPGSAGQTYGRKSRAICIKTLTVDTCIGTILILRRPAYHKTTIIQSRYRRLILTACNVSVHHKLRQNNRAIIGMNLGSNIRTGPSIIAAVITPGHDKAAILKSRYIRLILRRTRVVIDPKLTNRFSAVYIKDTRPDVVAAACSCSIIMTAAVTIPPGYNKITVRK